MASEFCWQTILEFPQHLTMSHIYIYQPDHHFFIIITSVIPAYHGKDNTAEVNLGWGREPPLLPVGQHTAPGKHHRRFFCDDISVFVVVED